VTRPVRRLVTRGVSCAVMTVTVLGGCASQDGPGGTAAQGAEEVVHPPQAVATSSRPVAPAAAPARGRPAAVTSVEIPRLGVRAEIVSLRLSGAALAGPERPEDVGWYAESPLPGDRGAAVLVGHVDSRTGPAVFSRLGDLRPGDRVVVRRTDGTVRFRVLELARYRRTSVPLQDVYGPTPDRALRLITCDGPYRRGSGYRDNVVVSALAE
jgi:LPXTG-site transpeptidase (sortase) family protein